MSDLERGQRVSARFETIRLLADALALSDDDRTLLLRTAQSPLVELTLGQPVPVAAAMPGWPLFRTSFVGRSLEADLLVGALTDATTRLVAVTGPGGVGKTRLAQLATGRVAEHYAGRVTWVDLSPIREPKALLTAICDSSGLTEPDDAARLAALCRYVAHQPHLLVLDNFEQIVEALPTVSDVLAGVPELVILVTSRVTLRMMAATEIELGPLALPPAKPRSPGSCRDVEAMQLFCERARVADRRFALTEANVERVAEICRRLDGLPLAIELAAARLNTLSLPQLADRLDHRLPLLVRGPRDAPHRQQTMSATIAWSYNLLEPAAQELFRHLAVFAGGFTLDTVEFVLATREADPARAIELLSTLIESNLVVQADDESAGRRFRMFGTIRDYGMQQLAAQGELLQAYEELVGFCRSLAPFGGGTPSCIVPAPWVARVDAERSNVRAAFRYLASQGDLGPAFVFAAAFGHYLYNRGPIDEAWSWFEQTLDASVPDPVARLQGLYWASHLSSHLGLTATAWRLACEALILAEEQGDLAWQASIVHCQALTQEQCGNCERAEALFRDELRLWEQAGETGLSGFAHLSLGVIAIDRGDTRKAFAHLSHAEDILAGMGGVGWIGMVKWERGRLSLAAGQLDDAALQFRESVRLAHEQKTTMLEHLGLVGLAAAAAAAGLHERASQFIGAAEGSVERTGQHFRGVARTLLDDATAQCQARLDGDSFAELKDLGRATGFAEWWRSATVLLHKVRAIADGSHHVTTLHAERAGG